MSNSWLKLFFRLSGFVFVLKQKMVQSESWVKAVPYAVLLILLELLLAIVSLPLYFFVKPDALQERGFIFPLAEHERVKAHTYIIRRKISITTIFGAGGIYAAKLLVIGVVSLFLLGGTPLLAATQNWDFSVSGDYTYDSAKIEVTGGVAQLKDTGSTTSGSTTNSGFDSDTAGWTYADWGQGGGEVNIAGARVTSGGNPGGYINVSAPVGKDDELGGYWRQPFTTTVDNPTTTVNFDWEVTAYDSTPAPIAFKLYVFVDTGSGVPTIGEEVWSSATITGTSGWASISNLDVSSKVTTAGTYYLKVAMWVETAGSNSGPFTVGYDNVILNWTKTTQVYDATSPTVQPTTSLTMPKTVSWDSFTETATKNGGEISYQLSEDDGSTWKYWTGTVWAVAGASNYNTAAVVNTNIGTFSTSSNKIMWKAFLTGNGSQQVILDNVAVVYTENTPPAVASLTPAQNTTYGYVNIAYNLQDANSDPSDLVTYEYSLTGAFAGEQVTMVASSTDPAHSGVTGLTTSPGGVAHTFVWDAKSQLGAVYNTAVYVRLRANDGIQNGSYAASSAFTVDYVDSVVSNVSAVEVLDSTIVQITYDVTDNTTDNLFVELQVSSDGGATWDVPTTSATGAVGSGVTAGTGKIITWNAGADYTGQQQNDIQVRVRAKDKWQNQGAYANSANFSLDTLAPTVDTSADLLAQPNAGDTTVLIGGSFTENNPSTNTFYAAINSGSYNTATTGTLDTAAPANQNTEVGGTLKGNDYISKVKITHTDDYGQSIDNENLSPAVAFKYVKPYTPAAPTLDNPITNRLDLTVNPNIDEITGLEYAILETTTNKYVQTDGSLDTAAVWQVLGTASGEWGNNTSVSGKVRVTGLSSPVAQYIFKVKSRNTSDTLHAASSESIFSATAQITNTAPAITLNSYAQTTDGTQYVPVDYTGTDGQGDISSLVTYQYSTDNTSWFTMTEKAGVGSNGTSNLVFLPTGSNYAFAWDSGTDLPNIEDSSVYVRLKGNDTLTDGSFGTSAAFEIDNKVPVVSAVTSAQNSGARTVDITYTLTDSNNSTVILDVSSDGGSTWNVATSSATGNVGAGVTPGAGKTITWDAGADFNNQYNTNMQARVRAVDTYGNAGSSVSSSNFTVDTKAPVVSNVLANQDSGADTFTFQYDVSEDIGNVTIALEISSDGGSTWVVPVTTAAGDIGSVTPGTGKTITWNGATDYNNQEKTNMQIRVTATDQFTNSSNLNSANFSLDTKAPRITSVSATQPIGNTDVNITYTLADQNNSLIEIDISDDGGVTWDVTDTNVTGDIGSGITAGSKTIVWAAKTDFNNQNISNMRVRLRGRDTFNNQSANTQSANFALDTLNPATNVTADLQAQPNAGDVVVLIGGSFTESNPNTNDFYVALNGNAYGSATVGSSNTATPANQSTATGVTLKGNDYISKIKITHTDDHNQTTDNENTSPSTVYKYVKPYTPLAPTVDNPTVGAVDVLINKNTSEVDGLEYAIYEVTQDKYVQADGTLGASAVWQTIGTLAGQWGNSTGFSGKINVNGLSTHSYLYQFKVKSRNTSDTLHAASSESALSGGASSLNQAPVIVLNSIAQTTDGSKYVSINYTGSDIESENSNIITVEYSTDNAAWSTMTEKAGVGSQGTSNLTFLYTGSAHNFAWDVNTDLPNTEDATVYVRLQANDGTSSGAVVASSAFTIDTKNPVVINVTASQTINSSNVTITYDLTELSNSVVELQISSDGGSTWNVATSSATGDVGTGITGGTSKTIIWNAGVDFNNQEANNIKTKVRAADTYGNTGAFAQSANFSIDTKAPSIANVAASQDLGSNFVTITYDISDANNSIVYIDISEDNGATWGVATTTLSGDVGSGVTSGTGKIVTWSGSVDFPNREQGNMMVRVRATDAYANASGSISSAAFSVDTNAPVITNVSASQLVDSNFIAINYDLADSGNVTTSIDISDDSGSTWTVTDVSVSGDIGAGISPGVNRIVVWNAGIDFNNQDINTIRVRVRGTDAYNNTSTNVESTDFSVDTLSPVVAVEADLVSQPNAGDTTVLIGGSFTETNPTTNIFVAAINNSAYSASTTGESGTASPANQATNVGATLNGSDFISKVKLEESDNYGHSTISENVTPSTIYKFVKPYTPNAPTVNNPQNSTVDVIVNAHAAEAANVPYAIYEISTNQYIQANGTLGALAVWQTIGTLAGQWGFASGVAGKITVNGITSPVAQYSFKVKSRNPSDVANASTSESNFSSEVGVTNTSPTISITSAGQVVNTNYVLINYSGTDSQNDTNNITTFEYSTDNSTWNTMTEKIGVGSNSTSSLVFSASGSAYVFGWDVSVDIPNTEDQTVYVRLQSTDGLTNSNLEVSSAFAIDTIGPVISNFNIGQTPGSSNVVINYDLLDNSGADNVVALQISSDNGATWNTPTTTASGDVGSGISSGANKTINWNAGTDFNNQENSTMLVRLTGTDRFGNQGNSATSNNFTVDTKGAVISAVTASQTVGSANVVINYDLADLSAAGLLVDLQISSDGGLTWIVPTTSVTGDVGAGQTTGAKTIFWNAGTDFANQFKNNMVVRVRAQDYFANQGSYTQSANFNVDTKTPVVSSVTASQAIGSDTVNVTYTLSDDTATNLNVVMDISEDNGSTWTVATTTLSGNIGSGQSTGSKTITWNAGTDFPGQYVSGIVVRIRALDNYSNQGINVQSSSFTVDTKSPVVSNVSALQTLNSNNVVFTYDLADDTTTNLITHLDISADNGSTWTVATTTLSGNIGTGQSTGRKTITWDAGTDFNNQDSGSLKVRVRSADKFSNAGNNTESGAFAVDTKNPTVLITTDLETQPQAGDATILVGGSFTETNPNTNSLYAAINAGAYGTLTLGTGSTATLTSQVVNAGTTLKGSDYVAKVKISETDQYNHSATNENLTPSTTLKFVKPYTPSPLTADNSTTSTVDVSVNKNPAEVTGLEYAIYENTTNKYVQADGTLGTNAVWQTGAVWGTKTVNGLSAPVSQYLFKTKSRNSSDVTNAITSESDLSAGAAAGNTAPVITISSAAQVSGQRYVVVNYTGTDLEDNTVGLATAQYSTDNIVWHNMTEKSGVGSSGKTNLTFTAAGASLNFAWDSAADLSNVEDSSVYIRLMGNDVVLDGNLDVSSAFALDLKTPQISNITAFQDTGSNLVNITYDLADLTSTNITVDLDISSDNGTTWTVAKTTLSGNIGSGQTAGLNKTVTWNAGTDFANQFNNTMQIRLRGNDSYNNLGSFISSSSFIVDSKGPVISNINASQVVGANNVDISYDLADDNSSNIAVAMDISLDSGATWTVATTTLSGNIGSGQTAGLHKTVTWNAGTDFANQFSNSFLIRLRALDSYNNSSGNINSSNFSVDTKAPVVSSVTATQDNSSSNIVVSYNLADNTTTGNNVDFSVSDDNGTTWNIATSTVGGNIGTGQGTGVMSLVWNAGVDYAGVLSSNMKVRVKATDAFGNLGVYVNSAAFNLDSQAPVLSNLTATQTVGTDNVVIHYDLAENTTTSTVAFNISSDGGLTWSVPITTLTGNIGSITSGGANKTVTWNPGVDFVNQEKTNMRVRIKAIDAYSNDSGYFSSSDFSLDTKAPAGLISISKFSSTTSTVTLNWSSGVADANFDHYEIWHGSNQADVDARTGSAIEWGITDDSNLSNILTIATVVTGVTTSDNYYVKIFAADALGHEATIPSINIFTPAPVTPPVTPVAPAPAGGGGGTPTPIVRALNTPILSPLQSPTQETAITISGLADARTRIDLYDNGILINRLSSVTNDNGLFSQKFTLSEGQHNLTVRAVDFDNNVSNFSNSINLVIGLTAPAAPIIISPTDNENITEATPQIIGIAEPLSTLNVTVDNLTNLITQADANGDWALILPSSAALINGVHNIGVTAVNEAGNISPEVAITITKIAPVVTAPPSSQIVAPIAPITPAAEIIQTSAEARELAGLQTPRVLISNSKITALGAEQFEFSGTALPNQDVIVYVHSDQALIYQTRADKFGRWVINHQQSAIELATGLHTIYAVTVDPKSNVKSRPSPVSTFTVEKNMWVQMFNYLNLQTTIATVVILMATILWIYRYRKGELITA